MSRENWVICNRCKPENRVRPPRNAGWASVAVIAPDGLNFSDFVADLCPECLAELLEWIKRGESLLA